MSNFNLFEFTDYRAFLLAYAQDSKRAKPRWTFGMWAKRLGVGDTSSITKIIRGQRHPGSNMTERLVKYFEFSQKEANYFRDLVSLQKVKRDPRLALILLEKMGKSHPQAAARILDDETFALISNWYCMAIREMARLDHFVEDPKWISKKLHFKVTPREASRAIALLLKVGLLKRNKCGQLQVCNPRFATKNDYASEAIKRYHEAMLENAKLALRKIAVDERDFQASVLTMSAASIPKAKDLIREFKGRFCHLLEKEKGDGTFQIQIQFFPLTKRLVSTRRLSSRSHSLPLDGGGLGRG